MIKKRLVALGLVGAITVSGCLVGCGTKDTISSTQDVTSSTTPQTEGVEETTEPTDESNTVSEEETTEPTEPTDVTDESNSVTQEEVTETTDATATVEGETVASKLIEEFRAETKTTTDVVSIAETVGKSSLFNEIEMVVEEVQEGDLNGFDEPIEGFSKGVMFAPMISTIPFIGYIFESENAEELASKIEEKGNINWNICTSADEKKVAVEGDKVIFIMSPYEFGK